MPGINAVRFFRNGKHYFSLCSMYSLYPSSKGPGNNQNQSEAFYCTSIIIKGADDSV